MPNLFKRYFAHPTLKRAKRVASRQFRKYFPETGSYDVTKDTERRLPQAILDILAYDRAMEAHGFKDRLPYRGRRHSVEYPGAEREAMEYFSFHETPWQDDNISIGSDEISELISNPATPKRPVCAPPTPNRYYVPSIPYKPYLYPYQTPTRVWKPKKEKVGFRKGVTRQLRKLFPEAPPPSDGYASEALLRELKRQAAVYAAGKSIKPYTGRRHSFVDAGVSSPVPKRAETSLREVDHYDFVPPSVIEEQERREAMRLAALEKAGIQPAVTYNIARFPYEGIGPTPWERVLMAAYDSPKKVFVPKRTPILKRVSKLYGRMAHRDKYDVDARERRMGMRGAYIPQWLRDQIRREDAMKKAGIRERPYTGRRHSLSGGRSGPGQVVARGHRSAEGALLMNEDDADYEDVGVPVSFDEESLFRPFVDYGGDESESFSGSDVNQLMSPERERAVAVAGPSASTPTRVLQTDKELMFDLYELEEEETGRIGQDLTRFQASRRRLLRDVARITMNASQ